jgi:glucose-6-phosphate-specific signal transduction histidine kinase
MGPLELFVLLWIVISFFIGMAAADKKIGFWAVFLISLFFSPLIGLIFGLASSKKESNQVVVKDKSISPADELTKLRELADKNVITEEEFQQQKKKILSL